MKFLFIITLISFSTLSLSAQTVAMVPQTNATKTTKTVDKEIIKKRHTRAAVQQLHVHLQNHLEYDETMEDYLVEGEFKLTVFIKPNGEIAKTQMGEDRSMVVHNAVKKAMKKIDKILYKGDRYEGAAQIQIPLKFSVN
ncbi:MAG: hypothetical protein Sapg2KO_37500 [Saprospiraceae bacterium]